MTSRLAFLAALVGLGTARAQLPASSTGSGRPWQSTQPANNVCPVCGTVAATAHRLTAIGTPPEANAQPVLTRCLNCSNAFFRDRE